MRMTSRHISKLNSMGYLASFEIGLDPTWTTTGCASGREGAKCEQPDALQNVLSEWTAM